MGALSADFRAAYSARLSNGLSIARVGSAQVSRFGLAPSHPLPCCDLAAMASLIVSGA
jgi:hypothetical protein